jgi:hypothetical protein
MLPLSIFPMLSAGAASGAHAGVPLPILAGTTGMPSLAALVKRIAPSAINIEGWGRVVAAPGLEIIRFPLRPQPTLQA